MCLLYKFNVHVQASETCAELVPGTAVKEPNGDAKRFKTLPSDPILKVSVKLKACELQMDSKFRGSSSSPATGFRASPGHKRQYAGGPLLRIVLGDQDNW